VGKKTTAKKKPTKLQTLQLKVLQKARAGTSYSVPRTTWPVVCQSRGRTDASLATMASGEAAGHL